jgi:GGDEF domain-containing protein
MNRRFVNALSAACVLAALLSAGSVAYRVLTADAAGRSAAKLDFEGLMSALAYVKAPSDLAEPGLRARLASRFEASPNLLLVDVYERGAGDRWRIPANTPYLPLPASGSAAPEPVYPVASTSLLSSPLKGDTSGALAVDALYISLTQQSVFEAFRDAMVGLMAFLAIAALILVVMGHGETASRLETASSRATAAHRETDVLVEASAPAASGLDEPGGSSVEEGTARELAAAAAEYQYDTLVGGNEEPYIEGPGERVQAAGSAGIMVKSPAGSVDEDFDIPVSSEVQDQGSGPKVKASGPVAGEVAGEAVGASAAAASQSAAQECGPEGLYSPASGLGWESYLEERLDAELSRSASFEQDLSLLVLSLDGLSSQDADYASIGRAIEAFFSFKDLAFERGDDGFSVILPNIDSAHAIKMAEEFYKKLAFLAEGDLAELELLPLFMGISSRAGRLVDASRMEHEAATALDKARYEKDTRIVAFKPDPDKYRLYLASKGA